MQNTNKEVSGVQHFINSISPELEALIGGVLLASADALMALTISGEQVTIRTAIVAVVGALLTGLTSFYRKKRGDGWKQSAKEAESIVKANNF